jgi:hypothetical protein
MNDNNYIKELRKDIKVIKKDLRAISMKTRSMARILEISEVNETTSKTELSKDKQLKHDVTPNKISKDKWLIRLFKKVMGLIKK